MGRSYVLPIRERSDERGDCDSSVGPRRAEITWLPADELGAGFGHRRRLLCVWLVVQSPIASRNPATSRHKKVRHPARLASVQWLTLFVLALWRPLQFWHAAS